ncbi:MAG TPA: alpha/beta fold hydrolase [Ktedonobacterales bacterium]|nr:alpha/beta fold hydrolase [Ktedonobacterales bacterium]
MQVPAPSYVAVNGRKIAYDEVAPEMPAGTVLLISGLGAKRLGWYKQLPVFGARYRTIAMDNRDIGDSDLVEAPYRTADQADDAAALLHALGIERAAVVGISMGGFIALELALRHPELVEKLVLTSTSAGGRTHVQPGWRMRMMLGMPRFVPRWLRPEAGTVARRTYASIMAPGYCAAHPDDWEHIAEIARYRVQPAAAYMRQLNACLGHDASARLGTITAPTLVVHGTVDPLVPPANGEYLAAHIPGARLIRYPATGHVPIIERADDYNRDVLAFLAE